MDRKADDQINLSDDQKSSVDSTQIELQDLKQKNEELNAQLQETKDSWLRALSDYKNLLDRTRKEKEEFLTFAGEEVVKKMLPVYDSLEMLSKFNQDQGLQLTVKQFQQVMQELGLEEIEVTGSKFDSSVMNAVEVVEGKKDLVIEVVQKGFNFRGRLLRASTVKVGKG